MYQKNIHEVESCALKYHKYFTKICLFYEFSRFMLLHSFSLCLFLILLNIGKNIHESHISASSNTPTYECKRKSNIKGTHHISRDDQILLKIHECNLNKFPSLAHMKKIFPLFSLCNNPSRGNNKIYIYLENVCVCLHIWKWWWWCCYTRHRSRAWERLLRLRMIMVVVESKGRKFEHQM